MAQNQLASFLELVQEDANLERQLLEASDPSAFAAMAVANGFDEVSPELVAQFFESLNAQQNTLNDDEELGAVAGGIGGSGQSPLMNTMKTMGIDALANMAKGAAQGGINTLQGKISESIDAASEKVKSKIIGG